MAILVEKVSSEAVSEEQKMDQPKVEKLTEEIQAAHQPAVSDKREVVIQACLGRAPKEVRSVLIQPGDYVPQPIRLMRSAPMK